MTATWQGLPAEPLICPGACGPTWSIEDVMNHLAAWQEAALRAVPELMQGRKATAGHALDKFNAIHHDLDAGLSLTETVERLQATRPGFFFHLLRNLAISVSGLGCIVTALGGLGIVLTLARILQLGMQGLSTGCESLWQMSFISLLKPAVGLIILGTVILFGGLIVNWIVTTPVYRSHNEKNQPQNDKPT